MAITKAIGRIFDAVSPAVGSRARDVWYTLNGGRAAHEAAVQEWRYSDLKELLRSLPKATDGSFAVHDSSNRLSRLGNSGGSALAVVSVVPPAKTGIANFTAKAFGAAEVPVDVFFPHNGNAEYLAATHRLGSPEQGTRFFSMEALDVGLALRGYRAVV
jgi:hypothetical protein